MAAPRDPRSGFLLTETIATFTISAFVLLGLVSAASVLTGAVDRSIAHVQNVDDLARTIGAIERDVGGLARVSFDAVQPAPAVFRGGPNFLYFARRDRGPNGMETDVVALREIVAGDGTRLVRADGWLPVTATGFAAIRFGAQRDLPTGPARVRFYYVAPSRSGVPEMRLTSWPSGPTMPAAVIVEAIDAASKRTILSTRVTIHADADIDCIGASSSPTQSGRVGQPVPTTTLDCGPEASPSFARLVRGSP